MSMSRVYITISPEMKKALERMSKAKGYLKIQDLIREILADWYAKQEKE